MKEGDKLKVSIYIKSCFRGNPRGTGEAAAIVEFIGKSGTEHIRKPRLRIEHDTRNALHLKICIAAVQILLKPCQITIYIDSAYVANACRLGWLEKWQRDGWKKANGKPTANAEDWKQFLTLIQIHTVTFAPYDGRHEEELKKVLKEMDYEKNKEYRDGL